MKMKLLTAWKNLFCNHERWTMDTQLLTMRCDHCGIFAWYNKEKSDIYKKEHSLTDGHADPQETDGIPKR